MSKTARILRTLLGSVAIEIAAGASPGQGILWEVAGSGPATMFGESIRSAGDVDGDGIEDLIVGEPGYDPGGVPYGGKVTVYSGATQSVIWSLVGLNAAVGSAVGGGLGDDIGRPGDLTADGIPELVLPQYGGGPCLCPGGVTVYSPLGARLGAWPGTTGAAVGDLNGDGMGDLVVGEPWWSHPTCGSALGRAYAVSGAVGPVLAEYTGLPCGWDHIGMAIEPLGDLSGDGIPDFAVAAGGDPLTWTWSTVRVYSGLGSAPIWTAQFLPSMVRRLSQTGDVNGDGTDDVLVGMPWGGPGPSPYPPPVGAASVLSGVDGSILHNFYGSFLQQWFGESVGRLGDLDGDGYSDVLVGAPKALGFNIPLPPPSQWPGGNPANTQMGRIFVFSGATGGTLVELVELPAFDGFGLGLDGLGDLDGDDYPDFAASEPWRALPNPGRVIAFKGAPSGVAVFGAGCSGPSAISPRIAAWPAPALGATVNVSVSRALPNASVALLLGASSTSWSGAPLPISLGGVGMPGCELLVAPNVILLATTLGPGPGKGRATVPLSIPASPTLVGAVVYAQWYVGGPVGSPFPGAMSRALAMTIQP